MSAEPHAGLNTRRALLRRFMVGGSLLGLGGGAGYARLVGPRWLSQEAVEVELKHLPAALDGLRIVQISDLHLEPFTTAEDIEAVVAQVNAMRPDLIAITGDFITGSNKPMGKLADILAKLQATLGVYACLGNHDLWHGPATITRRLQEVGITVLCNAHAMLQHRGASLCLAGTDSAWAGRPSLEDCFAGAPKDCATVLLAHEPDFADRVAQMQRPLLQLSGHSHGGQVRLPWLGSIRTPRWGRKYVMGRYAIDDVQLYVNRGIGTVTLPVRFYCPPEITEITLRSPEVVRPAQAVTSGI